jgi:TPR repeat protein
MKCYRKASELGSVVAMNSLGLLVESKNEEEALILYKKAHQQGLLDATVNLAILYLKVSAMKS